MRDAANLRYYSPWQICVATLLGSPLAGGYFSSRNYAAFDLPRKATIALTIGALITILTLFIGYEMPQGASGTAFAASIAGAYGWRAHVAFDPEITRVRSEGAARYSWWRVIGLSLGILLALLVAVYLLVLFLGGL